MTHHADVVAEYVQGVTDGSIVAGRLVKLAVRRYEHDLVHAGERGFYFDVDIAEDACEFFPSVLRHSKAEWASQPFVLTPFQEFCNWNIFGWRRAKDGLRRFRKVYITVARKNGKGLALDTPLVTPTGWTTMGEVQVGDELYDDNGMPTRISVVSEDRRLDCYCIVFSNGEEIVCDGDHMWKTRAGIVHPGCGHSNTPAPRVAVRNTRDLRETVTAGSRGDRNHAIALPLPLSGEERMLPIDPYVLGAWLGDGTSAQAALTCGEEDVEHFVREFESADLQVAKTKRHTAYNVRIQQTEVDLLGERRAVPFNSPSNIKRTLRRHNLLNNKHIPPVYLRASFSQRLALLQGLMDTDGFIDKPGTSLNYDTISPQLRDGVIELLTSLGVKCNFRPKKIRCNGRNLPGFSYRITFSVFKDEIPAFRLTRKLARMRVSSDVKGNRRSKTLQIVSITPVDTVTTRCIQVDSPSHMFLCGRKMIPTHNSTYGSGLGLLLMVADDPIEMGAEIYVAAPKEQQAAEIIFGEAKRMVLQSPDLEAISNVLNKNISVPSLNAFMRPLGSDSRTNAGWNPHTVLMDELCDWREHHRGLWGALTTGSGARRQPLRIVTCTAGDESSEIWIEEDDYATAVVEAVLSETVIDDEYFAMIARIDEARLHESCDGEGCEECDEGMLPADDPFDERNWEKSNPNLHATVKLDHLRGQAVEAKNKPSAKHDFLRYYCNIRVSSAVKLIDMDQWAKGAKELSDWNGTSCYGAFDLGWASDLASMSLTAKFFVDKDDDGNDRWRYETRQWSFIPSGTKADLTREPWASFIAAGHLIVTDGDTTDIPGAFKQNLLKITEEFDCVQWAFDPNQARHLATELENDEGMEVYKFVQKPYMYNESVLMFEKMITDGLYVHGGDPLLTWCAKHLRCKKDTNNDIMPDKKASREKIDPIVTSIMSLGGCMTGEQPNYWNPNSGVWL